MAKKTSGLTDKHKAALGLILEGRSVADISKVTGLSTHQLYDLQQGNTRAGAVAVEFHRALTRESEKQSENERFLVVNIKRKSLEIINEWLDEKKADLKKAGSKPEENLVKRCASVLDKINKVPTSISVGDIYNLNGEELVDEFKRLRKQAQRQLPV